MQKEKAVKKEENSFNWLDRLKLKFFVIEKKNLRLNFYSIFLLIF